MSTAEAERGDNVSSKICMRVRNGLTVDQISIALQSQ